MYVEPEGPGAQAGLQPRDVILKVNGEALQKIPFLEKIVALPHGEPVILALQRGKEPMTLNITVGALKRRNLEAGIR